MAPVIMYVINSFDRGGAEAGLVAMIRGGIFAGCHLSVVALVRGQGEIAAHLQETGHQPQILVDRTQMRMVDIPLLFNRLRSAIRRIKPDVVIASLPQANLLARMSLLFRKGIVFVSFEHNSKLAKRAYEMGYRLTSGRVNWVFADSESTLDSVLQRLYRRPPSKRSIVPLVSFSSQHQRRGASTDSGASTDRRFHIVNAARFTAVKNQAAIIRAVASLGRDVALTLYGDGPMRESCKTLAAQLGISEQVRFPGFVENWATYPADLFVLSSKHEGLCIVVLEAMHAGIPVAAPITGGLRDYARPGLLRELQSVDAVAIANAINEAIDDQPGNQAMAQKAQLMVERRFGSDAIRNVYGEINRSLIELTHIGRSFAAPQTNNAPGIRLDGSETQV